MINERLWLVILVITLVLLGMTVAGCDERTVPTPPSSYVATGDSGGGGNNGGTGGNNGGSGGSGGSNRCPAGGCGTATGKVCFQSSCNYVKTNQKSACNCN